MNGIRALAFALIAAGATEASQIGLVNNPVGLAAMAPRDNCPDMPALCTGPAMLYGMHTTLTYLCPEKKETNAPTTVNVTVTATTTVTMAPKDTGTPPSVMPPAPGESTTTTTTTSTQYMTITMSRKAPDPSDPIVTHPIVTDPIESDIFSISGVPSPDVSSDWLHRPTSAMPIVSDIPWLSDSISETRSDWLHRPTSTGVNWNRTSTWSHASPTTSAASASKCSSMWMPKVSSGTDGTSAKPTMHNGTSTVQYHFPGIHAARSVNGTASATLTPTATTGAASQERLDVAMAGAAMMFGMYLV